MSYILDALKKSEQERGRGDIPGVQTVHSSSLNYHGQKKSYWPYFLITAVLLNLAAIVYFIIDKEQLSDTVVTQETSSPSAPDLTAARSADTGSPNIANRQAESTVTGSAIIEPAITDSTAVESKVSERQDTYKSTAPVVIDPVKTENEETDQARKPAAVATSNTTKANATTAATSQATISQAAPAEDKQVIEFYELPESVKQELPAIIISAHIYSSNPLQRSIVINNNFMEEGEYVIDDLRLHEITPDGAIFDFRETRFHHGVVSSWQ